MGEARNFPLKLNGVMSLVISHRHRFPHVQNLGRISRRRNISPGLVCWLMLGAFLLLGIAPAFADTAQSDSPDFALDTTGVGPGVGGVSQADSLSFMLDTTVGLAAGVGISQADSSNFTLDTTGGGAGLGGISQADSSNFTLDTTGPQGVGGIAQADSADFTLDTRGPFTLVLAINGAGTVTHSPNQPSYAVNTLVILTATPNSGWLFGGWSGDAGGPSNPLSVTMTNNKAIVAKFVTPAALSSPVYQGNNGFTFTVSGATGANYFIQASTNLGTTNWVALFTNASPFVFVDPGASNYVQRFYRAVYLP